MKVGGTLNDYVTAMTVYRDQLYIGGAFTSPSHIARLSGTTWVPVGTGCNDNVRTMEVYHDSLFVGGSFTTAGGVPAQRIAKWHLPEAPVASFTVDSTALCPNDCTTFTDHSPNGVSSRSWSFPGGVPTTSTDSTPTVCYALPGTWPVTLTVTNAGGTSSATDSTAVWSWIFVQAFRKVCPVRLSACSPILRAAALRYAATMNRRKLCCASVMPQEGWYRRKYSAAPRCCWTSTVFHPGSFWFRWKVPKAAPTNAW